MFVSMNWVRDFVNLDGLDIPKLIHRFTLSTAEVEEVIVKGGDVSGVVAGRILEVREHPGSKKLHLVKVDAGDGVYECVCGAPNVREGILVPYAKEGARLSGVAVTAAEIVGQMSRGMCCSEAELGISADHSGLMELEDDLAPGTDICEVYGIRDIIFEVDNKSLTNRPDLWGHYGIAREFAALAGRELLPPKTLDPGAFAALPEVPLDIRDREYVHRYTAITVENIRRKKSPVDMRIRLYYCGSRAINLLADLTNWLMLELSQPMHAFDRSKVDRIEVIKMERDFKFTTLDGVERDVPAGTSMICSREEPVAIAGVMGGLATEITDDTQSLLLESASFEGVKARRTSAALGLRTDASMRYEKMIDPELTELAVARFLWLLTELDGGVRVTSRLTDVYVYRFPPISISLDRRFLDRYTGIAIEDGEIMRTLTALGFRAVHENGRFTVEVPSWRATKDVTIPADIIEEITRIHGYDSFEIKTTMSALYPVRKPVRKTDEVQIKELLVNRMNLHEVHSYLWADVARLGEIGVETPDNVRVLGAVNPANEVLRNCMIPHLLLMLDENRNWSGKFGLFEIGRVVRGLGPDGLCSERKRLGIVMMSRTGGERELYLELRDMLALILGDVRHIRPEFENCEPEYAWQHPVNTASVSLGGKRLGFLSVLHPMSGDKIDRKAAIVCAELDLDDLAQVPAAQLRFAEPSRYPGIEVDLSFQMGDGVRYEVIRAAIEEMGCDVLRETKLIDQYIDPQGGRSLAIRLFFSSLERTLARNEIQPVVDGLVEKLAGQSVTLRSGG